jgi:hypothetical protein
VRSNHHLGSITILLQRVSFGSARITARIAS